jgi:predicted GNAT family acetyltransferase
MVLSITDRRRFQTSAAAGPHAPGARLPGGPAARLRSRPADLVRIGRSGATPAVQNGAVSNLVEDNPARRRFEILVDDSLAGFAAYQLRPGVAIFTHTEVDPAFEGKGVGSALVRGALDQVRGRGERVIARCPFVAAYIERHPEYSSLLVTD